MTEGIIIAVITGLLSAFTAYGLNRKDRIKFEQNMEDRMKVLEKKVDEHNGYAQKFGEVAVAIGKMQTDISYLRKGC